MSLVRSSLAAFLDDSLLANNSKSNHYRYDATISISQLWPGCRYMSRKNLVNQNGDLQKAHNKRNGLQEPRFLRRFRSFLNFSLRKVRNELGTRKMTQEPASEQRSGRRNLCSIRITISPFFKCHAKIFKPQFAFEGLKRPLTPHMTAKLYNPKPMAL